MGIILLEDNYVRVNSLYVGIEHRKYTDKLYVCQTIDEAIEIVEKSQIDLIIIKILHNKALIDYITLSMQNCAKIQMPWVLFTFSGTTIAHTEFHGNTPKVTKDNDDNDAHGLNMVVFNNGIWHHINIDSIEYIEVNNKVLNIVTSEKTYSLSRCTLDSIKHQLPAASFLQCHRSYIVNRSRIVRFDTRKYSSINIDNYVIPVGSKYKAQLKDEYKQGGISHT